MSAVRLHLKSGQKVDIDGDRVTEWSDTAIRAVSLSGNRVAVPVENVEYYEFIGETSENHRT